MPAHRRVLVLVVLPSVLVAVTAAALYLVVLPLFPALHEYYFPQSTATYATYRVAIYAHIVPATVALVLGPVNLWNGLRGRHRRAHRRIGAAYTVSASLAATFGIVMAFHAYPGTIPGGRFLITSGMVTLGCVWLATLYLAVRAIAVLHDRDRHGFWIIVNVSAAYSAVWFRVLNGALIVSGRFDQLYPLLGWAGWVPSVGVGWLLARRWLARRTAERAAAGRSLATAATR
jgi:Predicted membrane protein (DUF2306)